MFLGINLLCNVGQSDIIFHWNIYLYWKNVCTFTQYAYFVIFHFTGNFPPGVRAQHTFTKYVLSGVCCLFQFLKPRKKISKFKDSVIVNSICMLLLCALGSFAIPKQQMLISFTTFTKKKLNCWSYYCNSKDVQ